MKESAIHFSAPMVQAILAGVTRVHFLALKRVAEMGFCAILTTPVS